MLLECEFRTSAWLLVFAVCPSRVVAQILLNSTLPFQRASLRTDLTFQKLNDCVFAEIIWQATLFSKLDLSMLQPPKRETKLYYLLSYRVFWFWSDILQLGQGENPSFTFSLCILRSMALQRLSCSQACTLEFLKTCGRQYHLVLCFSHRPLLSLGTLSILSRSRWLKHLAQSLRALRESVPKHLQVSHETTTWYSVSGLMLTSQFLWGEERFARHAEGRRL